MTVTIRTTWGHVDHGARHPDSLAARLEAQAMTKAETAERRADMHGRESTHGRAYMREAEHWRGCAYWYGQGFTREPRPYSDTPTPGERLYLADLEKTPTFHDGAPRPSWHTASDTVRMAWELAASKAGDR